MHAVIRARRARGEQRGGGTIGGRWPPRVSALGLQQMGQGTSGFLGPQYRLSLVGLEHWPCYQIFTFWVVWSVWLQAESGIKSLFNGSKVYFSRRERNKTIESSWKWALNWGICLRVIWFFETSCKVVCVCFSFQGVFSVFPLFGGCLGNVQMGWWCCNLLLPLSNRSINFIYSKFPIHLRPCGTALNGWGSVAITCRCDSLSHQNFAQHFGPLSFLGIFIILFTYYFNMSFKHMCKFVSI